jgi:hypothetical protein
MPLSAAGMAPTVEELRHGIRAGFAPRPYPGDEAIARRRPGCAGLEAEATWELFHGRDWREMVAVGRQTNLRDHLGFLTFEGFVYYLPAFLELSLERESSFDLDESLAAFLWSFPEEVAALLDAGQKGAVVGVLEHLAAEFDRRGFVQNNARAALDHYWALFTDEELGR